MLQVSSALGFARKQHLVVRAYNHFFSYPVTIDNIIIPGDPNPVQVRVYTPIGIQNPAPIVLVHGFVPDGNRNPDINALAYRLTAMGFLVTLPLVPAELRFEMRSSDLPYIRDTIQWTAHKTGQQVTVFAFSFGAGLAIAAAAQPSVENDVKLIFVVSPFNNLDSIGRYFIHQRVIDPLGHAYLGSPPYPLMIVAPYLNDFLPPADAQAIDQVIDAYNHTTDGNLPPNDPALLWLTATQKHELAELELANTPESLKFYTGILERHRAEIAAISPSSVLPHLKTPLYVLHGSTDSVFPVGEINWIQSERAGVPDTHILITPWIWHARADQPASPWQKFRVINFCASMLRRAAQTAPLPAPAPTR